MPSFGSLALGDQGYGGLAIEVFGAPWKPRGEAITLTEILDDPERYLDQEVVVETRIAKVCQKKGCIFVATDGEIRTPTIEIRTPTIIKHIRKNLWSNHANS